MGDVACNVVFALTSGLITYFYTNVMSVSAAMVGMIMLISRIFDGISDVAIGLIMDKVHSKHGRGRAWVLWMALPYGISAVALFCLPANATAAVQAIYIFITYNLCTTVVYTALNLPYGAMAPLMTSNEQDLARINLFRMAMSPIGNMIVSAASLPIINRMGGDQALSACFSGASSAPRNASTPRQHRKQKSCRQAFALAHSFTTSTSL